MTTFAFKAKDFDGQTLNAQLEAASRFDALAALKEKGFTVMDLQAISGADFAPPPLPAKKAVTAHKAKTPATRPAVGGRIPVNQLAEFCRQLTISVSAGVSLTESLESIAQDVEHPRMKQVLESIVNELQEGRNFSDALEKQGKAFGPLFAPLVRSAELAGSLPETLEQMADYMESSDELRKKIKSITIYPCFMAGFFVVVCIIMTLVVLPKFKDVFGGMGSQLPPLTTAVFAANEFLLANIFWVAPTILTLVIAGIVYTRTEKGAYAFDKLKLRLPVIGPCIRKLTVARFCRNLSIMVRGGVPVASAMEIAASVCQNKLLEQSLNEVLERIVSGSDISSSLGKNSIFPQHMIRMVAVGEQTGDLAAVLEKVSDAYEKQAENSVSVAASLAEPIFICIFGALILVMVMAIYLPVFTVSGHM
jgi:type IV pilus assembly protein PilC